MFSVWCLYEECPSASPLRVYIVDRAGVSTILTWDDSLITKPRGFVVVYAPRLHKLTHILIRPDTLAGNIFALGIIRKRISTNFPYSRSNIMQAWEYLLNSKPFGGGDIMLI